jgi:hypothetical protein
MSKDVFKTPSKGLLGFNLDKIDNVVRTLSLNSPLLKMILLGTGSYYAGKALTPFAARLLSPKLFKSQGSYDDMYPEEQEELKKNIGLGLAAMAVLPTAINNFDSKSPLFGYARFPEKESFHKFTNNWFKKTSSAFNPFDDMQAIPLSIAKDTIMNHSTLTPMTKATSLDILNTFPENDSVTGKNVIDRAVSSGIDFIKGGAFGAITAHALGLPNPYSTALITGTLNTIRNI